jgi:hypothetical protein
LLAAGTALVTFLIGLIYGVPLMPQEQQNPTPANPLLTAIAALQTKHQVTKAQVDAARQAMADFQNALDASITQIREAFKL